MLSIKSVHTLTVVILEPLSTTDESTLFRTMAPPCNVCCPLPTSVAASSSLTVLVPRGDPSPAAPESRSAHVQAELHSPLGCLACFGRSHCTATARSGGPAAFSVLLGRTNRFLRRTSRLSSAQWRQHVMYVSLLPTSVATSSCLTVLVPRGDPSPTAPESQSAHAASPRLSVLDVGRGEGRRSCILLLDALPASVGRIVLPLPDPVAPLRYRSCLAATTPPL